MSITLTVSTYLKQALEEIAQEALDGRTAIEREKVFYCKIKDFNSLETASRKVYQEQWEIRPKETNTGMIRVRKTSDGELSLTTKVFDGDSRKETEIEITEDIFDSFRCISPGGMIKTRYVWPIPDTKFKWEVDVYQNPDGSPYEWCKVDLECDNLEMDNPPFPIEFTTVISGKRDSISEEERIFIDTLFKTKFITPNPVLAKQSTE